jgi:hypothetical protein
MTAGRDFKRIAWIAGGLVLAFSTVSLWFAKQAHDRGMQQCEDLMAPLVAQQAGPDAVSRRLDANPETYPRSRAFDLSRRVSQLSPSREIAKQIAEAPNRSLTTRIYFGPGSMYYVGFFSDAEQLTAYACFLNNTD